MAEIQQLDSIVQKMRDLNFEATVHDSQKSTAVVKPFIRPVDDVAGCASGSAGSRKSWQNGNGAMAVAANRTVKPRRVSEPVKLLSAVTSQAQKVTAWESTSAQSGRMVGERYRHVTASESPAVASRANSLKAATPKHRGDERFATVKPYLRRSAVRVCIERLSSDQRPQ